MYGEKLVFLYTFYVNDHVIIVYFGLQKSCFLKSYFFSSKNKKLEQKFSISLSKFEKGIFYRTVLFVIMRILLYPLFQSNLVNLINFVFSLTAIYELMFLGSPFTGNVLPDSSIYLEVEEALNIWKSQYYAGFIIPLIYGLFWILLKLSDLNTFTKSHTQ